MASNLRTADGGRYNASTVFINGILDRDALERVGLPRLTGSYAWSLTVGNAAVGHLLSASSSCGISLIQIDRGAVRSCDPLLAQGCLGFHQSHADWYF